LGSLICIAVSNYTKIGQTVAEISHLTFFKMAAVLTAGKLLMTNKCHHAKFHQNQPNGCGDIMLFRFSRWPPSTVLDFEILKRLVTHQLVRTICLAMTNFNKIGQTVAEILHLTFFQHSGRSPSWIFKILIF